MGGSGRTDLDLTPLDLIDVNHTLPLALLTDQAISGIFKEKDRPNSPEPPTRSIAALSLLLLLSVWPQ